MLPRRRARIGRAEGERAATQYLAKLERGWGILIDASQLCCEVVHFPKPVIISLTIQVH